MITSWKLQPSDTAPSLVAPTSSHPRFWYSNIKSRKKLCVFGGGDNSNNYNKKKNLNLTSQEDILNYSRFCWIVHFCKSFLCV